MAAKASAISLELTCAHDAVRLPRTAPRRRHGSLAHTVEGSRLHCARPPRIERWVRCTAGDDGGVRQRQQPVRDGGVHEQGPAPALDQRQPMDRVPVAAVLAVCGRRCGAARGEGGSLLRGSRHKHCGAETNSLRSRRDLAFCKTAHQEALLPMWRLRVDSGARIVDNNALSQKRTTPGKRPLGAVTNQSDFCRRLPRLPKQKAESRSATRECARRSVAMASGGRGSQAWLVAALLAALCCLAAGQPQPSYNPWTAASVLTDTAGQCVARRLTY